MRVRIIGLIDNGVLNVLVRHVSLHKRGGPSEEVLPDYSLLDYPQILFDLTDIDFRQTVLLPFYYLELGP